MSAGISKRSSRIIFLKRQGAESMWEILEGIRRVIELFGNPVVLETTFRSIYVSGTATLLSALLGIPLGVLIGFKDFTGKHFAKAIFNALLGIPTVALGLILYLVFSHSGFLGFLDLLYTPVAVMIVSNRKSGKVRKAAVGMIP